MAYIGREPQIGNFQICDAITVVDAQAAYTMQVSSVDVSPESANHMLVSLNGILQAPTTSYTVAGSTITFASALETGDVIDFIQILGNVLDLGVPSDNTVSLAKLTATGTKDATTFLRGDNTFDVPPLGGITEADQWRLTASLNFSGSITPITANLERNDTAGFNYIGTGMTESGGVFTFPSTGIWMIMIQAMVSGNGATADYASVHFQTTQNNSTYVSQVNQVVSEINSTGGYAMGFGVSFFDVTDTSTHKCKFAQDAGSTTCQLYGHTNIQSTGFTFIRLGDT
jgi:hypothetical protein